MHSRQRIAAVTRRRLEGGILTVSVIRTRGFFFAYRFGGSLRFIRDSFRHNVTRDMSMAGFEAYRGLSTSTPEYLTYIVVESLGQYSPASEGETNRMLGASGRQPP